MAELLARPLNQQRLALTADIKVTDLTDASYPMDRTAFSSSQEDASLQRQERHKQGQCPSCGQQLFATKSYSSSKRSSRIKWLFGGPVSSGGGEEVGTTKRIPLTVQGQVERGQCLLCVDQGATDEVIYSEGGNATNPMAKISPLGCTAQYKGPYNDYGERHGEGDMTWSNGDVYQGSFFNGVRHGTGTLSFGGDGGEYVGTWECNHIHGSGTRRFPNGDVYVGSYVDGKRSGDGRFYYSNGDMYTGAWTTFGGIL
jgi:hypothetical protein